jgi:hypothetical protein
MGSDPVPWTNLAVGDRVRVAHMPNFSGPQHPDTLAVYEWLLDSGHVLTIEKLDWFEGSSFPWSDEIPFPRG